MALVSMGARSGFGVFVLPMRAECGWHRGTISLAAAIGALVSSLSQPFVGRLYDRLGGRQLILVSLVVSGVCTMLLALTTHILVLIVLFGSVLSIAMGGIFLTTTAALLATWCERHQATAVSLNTSGVFGVSTSANVGTWNVFINGLTLNGNDAGNYNLGTVIVSGTIQGT